MIAIDDQEIVARRGIAGAKTGETRLVALRPEAISLADSGGERNRMRGTIEDVSFLGSVMRIRVRFTTSAISLDTFNNPSVAPPQRGQPVTVGFAHEDVLVLEGAETD